MSSLLVNEVQTETAARIDLAAAHRLCAREAYPEALQNHMSIYLSEPPGRMLVTPGEVHWSTIRARDILLMDGAGTVLAGAGEPNGGTYVIHWPIHVARPDLRCLIHIHGTYSTALFMRRDALLETRASQAAMQVDGEIAYFDAYDGALFDREDGERMAQTLATSAFWSCAITASWSAARRWATPLTGSISSSAPVSSSCSRSKTAPNST